jgi:hypothetical protein
LLLAESAGSSVSSSLRLAESSGGKESLLSTVAVDCLALVEERVLTALMSWRKKNA